MVILYILDVLWVFFEFLRNFCFCEFYAFSSKFRFFKIFQECYIFTPRDQNHSHTEKQRAIFSEHSNSLLLCFHWFASKPLLRSIPLLHRSPSYGSRRNFSPLYIRVIQLTSHRLFFLSIHFTARRRKPIVVRGEERRSREPAAGTGNSRKEARENEIERVR